MKGDRVKIAKDEVGGEMDGKYRKEEGMGGAGLARKEREQNL